MSLMQRSWQRHHRVIEVLFAYLQALLEDVLTLRASWGGMCICNHLEHLITDVQHWSRHLEPVTDITLADDVAGLQQQLEHAHVSLFEAVKFEAVNRAPLATPALPHETSEQLFVHMFMHESHHRAQILNILKTHSLPLPDVEACWELW